MLGQKLNISNVQHWTETFNNLFFASWQLKTTFFMNYAKKKRVLVPTSLSFLTFSFSLSSQIH